MIAGLNTMTRFIYSDVELKAALDRVAELMDFVDGSDEFHEMEDIADAIERYIASLRFQRLAANDDARAESPHRSG